MFTQEDGIKKGQFLKYKFWFISIMAKPLNTFWGAVYENHGNGSRGCDLGLFGFEQFRARDSNNVLSITARSSRSGEFHPPPSPRYERENLLPKLFYTGPSFL